MTVVAKVRSMKPFSDWGGPSRWSQARQVSAYPKHFMYDLFVVRWL